MPVQPIRSVLALPGYDALAPRRPRGYRVLAGGGSTAGLCPEERGSFLPCGPFPIGPRRPNASHHGHRPRRRRLLLVRPGPSRGRLPAHPPVGRARDPLAPGRAGGVETEEEEMNGVCDECHHYVNCAV